MDKSQLLILGNGFDLHCGLRSSYKDFFRSTILDRIGEPFGIKQLQAGVVGFWEGLFLEYHKINERDDYNWCNIEEIIKNTLWLIYYGEDGKSTNIECGLWRIALNFINDRRDLIDEKIYQNKPITRYIFVRCVKFFECIKFEEYSIEMRLNLLSMALLQELNKLESCFCKYIRNNIENREHSIEYNTEYILKFVNFLINLAGYPFYKYTSMEEITPSGALNGLSFINILSFNYTEIFDILGVVNPCAYNNVHGTLCMGKCVENCKKLNIIFGIDDNLIQTQGVNSPLRIFSKTYRKMLNTNEQPISILPPNNTPIEIKFYGHSLGEADYSYFQSIFDYYDLYGNSDVSLIFYYSKGYEQHDAIYRLISSYGKTLTNKEQGKNLIHKLLLENRLKIQEIKD